MTGDFLGEPEAVETAVESVRPVRGRIASWFVLGSNDYFVPRPLNYLAYFRRRRSRRRAASAARRTWSARSVADGWERPHGLAARRSRSPGSRPRCWGSTMHTSVATTSVSLPGARDSASARGDALARHRSRGRGARLRADRRGHTHGGQVRLPWIGALVTNCSIPPTLASGLVRMGSAILHTSRGLGTSKYAPFRFWCRPEATFLELRPGRQPLPATRYTERLGTWRSLVARSVRDAEVAGSNPAVPTKKTLRLAWCTAVPRLTRRSWGIEEEGSVPVTPGPIQTGRARTARPDTYSLSRNGV